MLKYFVFSILFLASLTSTHAMSFSPLQKVQVPERLRKKLKSFEPSAVLYLPDVGRYLLASDDTDKNETPYLFLMKENGEVDESPVLVQGLAQMTDIESLSQDGQDLYLLSSLGLNKKGANKFSRNLFAKVTRRGNSLVLEKKVELRSLLIDAIKHSNLPEFASIITDLESDLDIESHFISRGELYVGLKNPQPRPGQALILNLGSLEVLLNEERIEELSVWRTIDFSSVRRECLLSDLQLAADDLYLSTTSDRGEPGRLWHLQISTNKLALLHSYDRVKPEGLALRDIDDQLMIVFDQGIETPLFSVRSRY